MLYRNDFGFDFIYLKRYRLGAAADESARYASVHHPRLTAATSHFDTFARFALTCDNPIIEWDSLQSHAPPKAIEQFISQSGSMGLHNGVAVVIRLQRQTSYVWELTRNKQNSDILTDEFKYQLVGSLYMHSLHDQSFDAPPIMPHLLTDRETEILNWCAQGKTYTEIGRLLGISSKTVEFHMTNSMRKLGVNDKLTAILAALRAGFISF